MSLSSEQLPAIEFPDGTRVGGPVPGSKYRRSICAKCREPIRVKRAGTYDLCERCDNPRPARDNGLPVFRATQLDYHGDHCRTDV